MDALDPQLSDLRTVREEEISTKKKKKIARRKM